MTANSVKIDWYSFSFFVPFVVDEGERENLYRSAVVLNEIAPELGQFIEDYGYEISGGRRPYRVSVRSRGVSVFTRASTEWMLCEISGQGCKLLSDRDALLPTINETHKRCTRIDLALDIKVGTENKVGEFVRAGYSKRFSSKQHAVSGTGTTHYIGSRTSDKYCRVYQYNPPHPRAENMRIEIEFKNDTAKEVAKSLVVNSVTDEFFARVKGYNFQSKLMPEHAGTDYSYADTIVNKKQQNSTLLWIIKQCVPAFKRLVADGTIEEPHTFVKEYFLD